MYGTTGTRIRHLERARTNVHARWRCLYNVVPAWRAGEPRRGGCTTKTHGPAQAHGQALCVRACPCDMGAVVGACVCCALCWPRVFVSPQRPAGPPCGCKGAAGAAGAGGPSGREGRGQKALNTQAPGAFVRGAWVVPQTGRATLFASVCGAWVVRERWPKRVGPGGWRLCAVRGCCCLFLSHVGLGHGREGQQRGCCSAGRTLRGRVLSRVCRNILECGHGRARAGHGRCGIYRAVGAGRTALGGRVDIPDPAIGNRKFWRHRDAR